MEKTRPPRSGIKDRRCEQVRRGNRAAKLMGIYTVTARESPSFEVRDVTRAASATARNISVLALISVLVFIQFTDGC